MLAQHKGHKSRIQRKPGKQPQACPLSLDAGSNADGASMAVHCESTLGECHGGRYWEVQATLQVKVFRNPHIPFCVFECNVRLSTLQVIAGALSYEHEDSGSTRGSWR